MTKPSPPRDDLYSITIRLHAFNSADDAVPVADIIRERGVISYMDMSNMAQYVSISDVTVEGVK